MYIIDSMEELKTIWEYSSKGFPLQKPLTDFVVWLCTLYNMILMIPVWITCSNLFWQNIWTNYQATSVILLKICASCVRQQADSLLWCAVFPNTLHVVSVETQQDTPQSICCFHLIIE